MGTQGEAMRAWVIQRTGGDGHDYNLFVVIGTRDEARAKARELEAAASRLAGAFYVDGPKDFVIGIKP